jgi:hypothetical protein
MDNFFRQTVKSINSPYCIEVTAQSGVTAKFLQFKFLEDVTEFFSITVQAIVSSTRSEDDEQ